MSRIYLDSNVFSNLRINNDPKYQQLNKLLKLYQHNLSFFFSHAHIRDKKKDTSDLKYLDFQFIESLTKDNYISYHGERHNTSLYLATPLQVYKDEESVEDLSVLFTMFKPSANDSVEISLAKENIRKVLQTQFAQQIDLPIDVSDTQKKIFERFFPVRNSSLSLSDVIEAQINFYEEIHINSESYKELRRVIDEGINNGKYSAKNGDRIGFNEELSESILKKTFLQFVQDNTLKDNKGRTLYYDFFQQAYFSLDILGIKKDKISKKNGFINLLNDGLHAYYGRYFDYFVTADKKSGEKVSTLYSLLDCSTVILSVEKFIEILPEIGKTTDDTIFTFFEKLANDIKKSKRGDEKEEFGVRQSIIFTDQKYFNFFDSILEVKENSYTHYYIRKIQKHFLSFPNYREMGMIIDRCLTIFGMDILQRGVFNFEKEVEEMKNDMWLGRLWKIGTLIILLRRDKLLNEFCLLISPEESTITNENNGENK